MPITAYLLVRLKTLESKEAEYWDDELYSDEALKDTEYRAELERRRSEVNPQYASENQMPAFMAAKRKAIAKANEAGNVRSPAGRVSGPSV
jgi:hypothetical protein